MSDPSKQGCTSPRKCGLPWQMMIIDLTGEVMPCPYYHLSDTGQTLGNTNTDSLATIWNGAAFQDLRARHVAGNLEGHPCGRCVIARMMGTAPFFEWGDTFREESGHCFTVQIPETFWRRHDRHAEDIEVLEDGVALPHGGALHDDIRRLGEGRYSVWKGFVYLSTVDGSHPAANGRTYSVRCGDELVDLPRLDLDALSGRNLQASFEDYRAGRTVVNSHPSKITFIETSDCNIDCPSCSQNEVRLNGVRHRPQTSPDVMSKVPYLQQLIWHGGEPYMMPQFRQFVDRFEKSLNPNFSFGFMSNGTMLNAAELAKLEKFPQVNITISIDSFRKESYDKMRLGAQYDRVMRNMLGVVERQNHPVRKFTVAQIIGKTNIRDLPDNISYAMERDIRLMVNPITQYPPTEMLTLVSGLEELDGWEEALDRADMLLAEARRLNRRFIEGLDPSGAVQEMRSMLERHRREFSDTVDLVVDLTDPHGSLARMRRPGLFVWESDFGPSRAITYLPISRDGTHRLLIPRSRFSAPIRYGLYPDLHEICSVLEPSDSIICPSEERPLRRALTVPPYEAPVRPRNWHYIKNRRPVLETHDRAAMLDTYAAIAARERMEGSGFATAAEEPMPDDEALVQGAASRWKGFLTNYFKPFLSPTAG